jgi:hypothetical protein
MSGCVDFLGLSLLNGRTRIRWWSPVQEIRVHGPKKTGAAPSNAPAARAKRLVPRTRILLHGVKAFEKSVFGPCTQANMGHPSRTKDSC